MSPHEKPAESQAAVLNDPEQQLQGEGTGHVVRIFQKIPGQTRAFKNNGQGVDPGPSRGCARVPPTPAFVHKMEAEAAASAETHRVENGSTSSPSLEQFSTGNILTRRQTLVGVVLCAWDATLFIPTLPFYWALLTSVPFGGSICTFSLSEPPTAERSPLWLSKGPCCCCLW